MITRVCVTKPVSSFANFPIEGFNAAATHKKAKAAGRLEAQNLTNKLALKRQQKEKMETIVALATPFGRGGINVIRLSGDTAVEIASRLFDKLPKEPNKMQLGTLKTAFFSDKALAVYFAAPNSFTGEDVVEFHCHGGTAIAQGVISAFLASGARIAEGGEFTKRAVLNGKMSLINAEGAADMINANTLAQVRNGYNILTNKLTEQIKECLDQLVSLSAKVEVALDYPDDYDFTFSDEHIFETMQTLRRLQKSAAAGNLIANGIDVAIVGKPNVGKSTLLNALVGYDRAIVSSIAGTTRDCVSESILYKDTRINFIDTAGLRETTDQIELLGIQLTHRAINNSGFVLMVVDGQDEISQDEVYFIQSLKELNKPHLILFNKGDIITSEIKGVVISAKCNLNLQVIFDNIYAQYQKGAANANDTVLTNARHISAVNRAVRELEIIEHSIGPLDCVATQLLMAINALGEITGDNASESVIDNIFSNFCVGK